MIAYCIDDNCSKDVVYLDDNYNNYFLKSKNIIKFKISNFSKNNYIINISCNTDINIQDDSFPNKNYGLNLNNLNIINNNTNKLLQPHDAFVSEVLSSPKNHSISFNQKLNYTDTKWNVKNEIISDKIIELAAGEIKYFETIVNLPYNKPSNGSFQSYILSSTEDYSASMKFCSNTTNIKKYLTWSQLKNIEENNYKLFHGTITSENSVPIVFVD